MKEIVLLAFNTQLFQKFEMPQEFIDKYKPEVMLKEPRKSMTERPEKRERSNTFFVSGRSG